ncbi:MAG: PTS sugar transporter subunit IIC [Paraclostridium sordellii]|uniref:PTS sugar transporter subunit IIC n=1 Tax=Paraclostridium sordellii TaxID=1505 RepID=UPI0005E84601|nr:PTS sugar transporter subunit IIC [Paeniclostridium sordellii]CEN27071.1 regulatory protein [[Clostridium] sordellii] [Paeniclostridium sordellii]
MMQIITSTALLLAVLALFSLFCYKAPYGMKAMGALASAACASFLVQAFHGALFGEQVHIAFLGSVGSATGSLSGVAAAILVPLALGVSPVYAVLVGLSVSGFGILPGFVAGYLTAFVVKFLEKKAPAGLDLIIIILIAAPLSRGIATFMDPLVKSTLMQIGQALTAASSTSPIFMAIILGGLITVVGNTPLSSMALTSVIGLTGLPMAIGALAVFGSSFTNFVFFSKMKFGDKKDTISVAIEPLTQSDVISANPIPIFTTNFIGGALSGIVVALVSMYVAPLAISVPGMATPIAGFAVAVGQNGTPALIAAGGCIVASVFSGLLGHRIFSNHKIVTVAEIRGDKDNECTAA